METVLVTCLNPGLDTLLTAKAITIRTFARHVKKHLADGADKIFWAFALRIHCICDTIFDDSVSSHRVPYFFEEL
jgi:hypothetical protein